MVCYDRTIFGWDTSIWKSEGAKNKYENKKHFIYLFIEKITFKYVQIKFLSMHINNLKFTFCVYTVGSFKI